jgi:hypothetical protein
MRPRTKGDPIIFRPPVHISAALDKICAATGTTRAAYVEALLVADITARLPARPSTPPYLGEDDRA